MPDSSNPSKVFSRNFLVGYLFIAPVVMLVLGYIIPNPDQVGSSRLWSGFLMLVLMAGFILIAGRVVTGDWSGAFIDQRNKISLARLQTLLWTLVILVGFGAIALANAALECTAETCVSPLAIQIPQELWLLLGISATSLIGAPLVLSTKTNVQPDPNEANRNLNLVQQQNETDVQPTSNGLVVTNQKLSDARWVDIIKGEETGNGPHLDLAKIQMLFFTLIIVLTYAVSLADHMASDAVQIDQFPALDQSLVWLLGISHAAYLTNKAVPHSKEDNG